MRGLGLDAGLAANPCMGLCIGVLSKVLYIAPQVRSLGRFACYPNRSKCPRSNYHSGARSVNRTCFSSLNQMRQVQHVLHERSSTRHDTCFAPTLYSSRAQYPPCPLTFAVDTAALFLYIALVSAASRTEGRLSSFDTLCLCPQTKMSKVKREYLTTFSTIQCL